MTKIEARRKMKEKGFTLKQLADQSSYSLGFMTYAFRFPEHDAAFLPIRIFETLKSWGIVDYRREDVLKPTERQLELLKKLGYLVRNT